MEDSIKINFKGATKRILQIQQYTNDLSLNYDLSFEKTQRYSSFDGISSGNNNNLIIEFFVNSSFMIFIKTYLIKKGAEWFLKELLFKPFFDWIENLENNNVTPADDLHFIFDDIMIKIAYSRGNHINAVSQISLWLTKLIPELNSNGHGNLTIVATPVRYVETEWRFVIPNREFQLNDFLTYWGLEFNNNNRCVFEPRPRQIIYQPWW